MDFTNAVAALLKNKLLLAAGLVVAVLVAVLSTFNVTGKSPFIESRSSTYGAASAQYYVDSARSSLSNTATDITGLAARAQIVAQFMGSDQVRAQIARRMGVPVSAVQVSGQANNPSDTGTPQSQAPRPAGAGLSLTWQTQQDIPVVYLFTSGPDGATAARLADAAVSSLSQYVDQRGNRGRQEITQGAGDPNSRAAQTPASQVVVRRAGAAAGYQVGSETNPLQAVGVGLGIFVVWCLLLLTRQMTRAKRADDLELVGGRPTPGSDQAPEHTTR